MATDGAVVSRTLTLVFTDLADSTALKSERGDRVAGNLIAEHRGHVQRLSIAAGGRVIDWAGDGCFLTFPAPSAAVSFALELQRTHAREAHLPGVRVGIHLGEVSERTGPDGEGGPARVEGLAVDLAARISGLARPGQILLSVPVADSARPRLDPEPFDAPVRWATHGAFALKGFAGAMEIREVGLEGLASFEPPAASEKAAPAATSREAPGPREAIGERAREKPILAVLPFANLSAGDDEYFADGLTEDIITTLARFRELIVVGRASTFRFKGQAMDLSEVREQLRADYVVQGTVRRVAGRVRVTAQLVDPSSGFHVWADKYDRDMEDIFAVQDEVTRTIAATLGVTLQDVATQRALKKSPGELGAYDSVLRARRYTSLLRADVHAEARDLLEKAIGLDPDHAEAHALLVNVYLAEHRFGANPRPDPIGRALAAAEKATALDPQSAYARCWLGIVHFFRGENDMFQAEAQRALDLNPNDPEILADIGHYLAFMGEFERGLALSRQARALNPLHPGWYFFSEARYDYDRRSYENVLTDVARISMPHFYWTHLLAAAARGQLGRPDAEDALAELFARKPDFSARAELEKWNAAPEDLEHLMDGLRKAGLADGA